jgi:phosphatidylglycerophosphate synthase
MVRKIPRKYENPIDNVLLDMAERALPMCRALGLTPNQVTVASIFFGVLSIWALWAGKPAAFFATYFASVWLDYLDGHLARGNGEVTKLGDFMDHCSDVLHVAGVALVIAVRLGFPGAVAPILGIASFMSLSNVHLGLQQRYYTDNGKEPGEHSETLDALMRVAPHDYNKWLPVSRYFGVGTAQTATALIAWFAAGRMAK